MQLFDLVTEHPDRAGPRSTDAEGPLILAGGESLHFVPVAGVGLFGAQAEVSDRLQERAARIRELPPGESSVAGSENFGGAHPHFAAAHDHEEITKFGLLAADHRDPLAG